MADVYQRLLGPAKELDAGQYTTVGGYVSIACKKCGSVAALAHPVEASGRVGRAFACLTVTCGYREYVQLEAWGVQ